MEVTKSCYGYAAIHKQACAYNLSEARFYTPLLQISPVAGGILQFACQFAQNGRFRSRFCTFLQDCFRCNGSIGNGNGNVGGGRQLVSPFAAGIPGSSGVFCSSCNYNLTGLGVVELPEIDLSATLGLPPGTAAIPADMRVLLRCVRADVPLEFLRLVAGAVLLLLGVLVFHLAEVERHVLGQLVLAT